jgi:deazaflavin-dependent oxidoreductase (nitroreductase family)
MWYNSIMIWLLKSPLHFATSKNMMLISYTGRKSGKEYTTPVNYFQATDELGDYFATTSKSGRVWWRNLRGGAPVTVRITGNDLPATAVVFEDKQNIAQGMYEFLSQNPGMTKYFKVELDESGEPNLDEIAANISDTVLIKTRIQ